MATDTQVPQSIVDQFATLSERIKNEGITDNSGKMLVAPTAAPVLGKTDPYNPNLAGVTSINDSNKAMVDFYAQQAKDYAAAKATAEKNQVAAPKSFDEFLSSEGKVSPTTFQSNKFADLGIDPAHYFAELKADTAAIDALNTDLNDTIAQRDQAIANVEGRAGGTLDFMNAEATRINRNANVIIGQKTANINAKMALIEMKKGNFNDAQNYVKDAVNAYTSSLSADLQLFTDFRKENKDLIDNLDSKYQTAIANEYKVKSDNLATLKADKDKVGNLMLQFPSAGITMADSLDQATAKASKFSGRNTQIVGSADTGYTLVTYDQSGKVLSKTPVLGGTSVGGLVASGFGNPKVESSIRQDAVALLDQIDAGATTKEKAFSKLRKLYSPAEVSDAAIQGLLDMTPTAPGAAGGGAPMSQDTGIYGQKNNAFAKIPIQDRITQLSSIMKGDKSLVVSQLIQDGYQPSVARDLVGGFMNKTQNFIGGVFASLFSDPSFKEGR